MALPKNETPTFRGTVPSTKKRFEFRPFLVKEQKILLIALESQDIEQMYIAFRDILKTCVLTPDAIDVEKSPAFDIESVFMQISAKSVGEQSNILVHCNKCQESNEVKIETEHVYVKNFEEASANTKIQLTDNLGIILKYPSLYDSITITTANAKQKNSETQMIYDTIIASLESVYDTDNVYPIEDQTKEDVIEFIDSLTIDQMKKVEGFFENIPYLAYDLEFTCSSCGHVNKQEIQGMKNFF